MRRTISFTEISKALSCSAAWDLTYGGRLAGSTLKPRSLRAVLSNGRAWGAAVAVLHEQSRSPVRALYASDALRAALLDARYESFELSGLMPDLGLMVEQVDRLEQILETYITTVDLFDNLTHLEGEIVVPIPHTRMDFQCFLDGYTIAGHWGRRVVEFKLRGSLQDAGVIELGRQPRWYAWAFRELQRQLGLPDDLNGVFIDETLNAIPKEPRTVKRGKEDPRLYACPQCGAEESVDCQGARGPIKTCHPERRALVRDTFGPSHATDQMCKADDYIALCAAFGEEPNESTIEHLRSRQWHQRAPFTYTSDELDEAGEELASAARYIRDLDNGRHYPIRNGKPTCKGCDFYRICANPRDEMLVNAHYVRGIPKRDRGKRVVSV